MTPGPGAPVDCFRCANFVITYEKSFPYACRVFGFKGKILPAHTVFESTGRPCQAFVPRPDKPGSGPGSSSPAHGGKDGWLV